MSVNGMEENMNLMEGQNKMAVAWIDLTFYGQSVFNRRKDPILNAINGCVDFGTITALMGPSGSGKTTLLKCINGRLKSSEDSKIYLSSYRDIKPCFIEQEVSDHLMNGLTAFQAIIYASKLKNLSKECDHKSNARKLMSELMIGEIEKTLVENCSGGERKRLVIAQELTAIDKPNLLCIDEPTSGLDSNAAEIVIQCLHDVSQQHSLAVLTSIHQPNNDLLMLFDSLYVLAKGGICMYNGTPDRLYDHLEEAGIQCKEYQAPVEALMKFASIRNAEVEILLEQTIKDKEALKERCAKEVKLSKNGMSHKSVGFSTRHFLYLVGRAMTSLYVSQWKSMIVQFLFIIFSALFLSIVFDRNIGKPDGCFTKGQPINYTDLDEKLRIESLLIQNLTFIFFSDSTIIFIFITNAIKSFAPEIRIFFNEHKNGWYSTGSYFLAKNLVDLPFTLVVTICHSLLSYKTNHQIDDNNRMLSFIALSIIMLLCGQGLAVAIATIFTNGKLAMMVFFATLIIFSLQSGFYLPLNELPFKWLPHISFLKQVNENRLIIVYGFDRCSERQTQSTLFLMGLSEDTEHTFWINCFLLIFYIILYRVITLLALIVRSNSISFDVFSIRNSVEKKTKSEIPFRVVNELAQIERE